MTENPSLGTIQRDKNFPEQYEKELIKVCVEETVYKGLLRGHGALEQLKTEFSLVVP